MPQACDSASRGTCYDLVLVGGGLQNGLIALACLQRNPALRIALIERDRALGGNHTWALHPLDVPQAARPFVDPLIVARWAGYEVRFATRSRVLRVPYAAVSSQRFAAVVGAAIANSPG